MENFESKNENYTDGGLRNYKFKKRYKSSMLMDKKIVRW